MLPHIYTNGVLTWCPKSNHFSFDNCLTLAQGAQAIALMQSEHACGFMSATDGAEHQYVFHGELHNEVENNLLQRFQSKQQAKLLPVACAADYAGLYVTNVSMIGPAQQVNAAEQRLGALEQLVCYSGPAMLREDYRWLDAHHLAANKGSAVRQLQKQLNKSTLICFGDSDNDASMFSIADESYAPANAKDSIKAVATDVIGHHHEDGIAKFLRQRFDL